MKDLEQWRERFGFLEPDDVIAANGSAIALEVEGWTENSPGRGALVHVRSLDSAAFEIIEIATQAIGTYPSLILHGIAGIDQLPNVRCASLTVLGTLSTLELERVLLAIRDSSDLGAVAIANAHYIGAGIDLELAWPPHVASLDATWSQISNTRRLPASIVRLTIEGYTGSSPAGLPSSPTTRSLTLGGASSLKDLEAIGACFPKLERLILASCTKLSNIRALNEIHGLEELAIISCRMLDSISVLGGLPKLRHLELTDCGPISSLKPLEKHPSLERVILNGNTTVADSDLSALMCIPKLTDLVMVNRRSYRPQVRTVLTSRGLRDSIADARL